jgi:hypothetical protein
MATDHELITQTVHAPHGPGNPGRRPVAADRHNRYPRKHRERRRPLGPYRECLHVIRTGDGWKTMDALWLPR